MKLFFLKAIWKLGKLEEFELYIQFSFCMQIYSAADPPVRIEPRLIGNVIMYRHCSSFNSFWQKGLISALYKGETRHMYGYLSDFIFVKPYSWAPHGVRSVRFAPYQISLTKCFWSVTLIHTLITLPKNLDHLWRSSNEYFYALLHDKVHGKVTFRHLPTDMMSFRSNFFQLPLLSWCKMSRSYKVVLYFPLLTNVMFLH